MISDRSRLKDDLVPSVFYFKSKEQTPTIPEESPRAKRLKQRSTTDQAQLFNDFDFQYEAVIESFEHRDEEAIEIVDDVPREQGIQCDIPTFCKLSIASVQYDDKMISYYTGFDDYNHFLMFFQCLGKAVYDLEYKCSLLDPKDQLFMTLMKLRQAKRGH